MASYSRTIFYLLLLHTEYVYFIPKRYSKDGTIIPATTLDQIDNSLHTEDKQSSVNNTHTISPEINNVLTTESGTAAGSGSLKFTIKSVDKLAVAGDANYTAEIMNISQGKRIN